MASPFPRCPAGIDPATLSALHDGALPPDIADTLRAHSATCAACQRHAADFAAVAALLRRPDPALESSPAEQRAIWRAVQARMTPPTRTPAMTIPRRTLWRGAAAALIVALSLVLILQFVGHGMPSPRPLTTHPTATATPSPTYLTPEGAWGATSIHTITLTPTTFLPDAYASDGSLAIGTLPGTDANTRTVAMLNLHWGSLLPITTVANDPTAFYTPVVDTHFIAFVQQAGQVQRIVVIDLATRQTTILTQAPHANASTPDPLSIVDLDQGHLLWLAAESATANPPPTTLHLTDLESFHDEVIATHLYNDRSLPQLLWPSLLYEGADGTTMHLVDALAHTDQPLPATGADLAADYLLTASGVYYISDTQSGGAPFWQVKVLYRPDHSGELGQVIHTVSGQLVGPITMNDRLIAWNDPVTHSPIIWDRLTQRTITIHPQTGTVFSWTLHGDWLMYTITDDTGAHISEINTAHLLTP